MILLISIHDAAAAWAAAVIDEEQAANAWPALEGNPICHIGHSYGSHFTA